MKRSFRVATVFTGAAAAVSLTPAVNAVAMPGNAVQVPKAQEATPNITVENCNSGTRQWIHLYYTAAEHHGPVCLGHPGTYIVPNHNTVFQSFCAGNNFGRIIGKNSDTNLSSSSVTFGPGARIPIFLHSVTVIDGRGQTDNDTCPQ
jgi:hypothetical protein